MDAVTPTEPAPVSPKSSRGKRAVSSQAQLRRAKERALMAEMGQAAPAQDPGSKVCTAGRIVVAVVVAVVEWQ